MIRSAIRGETIAGAIRIIADRSGDADTNNRSINQQYINDQQNTEVINITRYDKRII